MTFHNDKTIGAYLLYNSDKIQIKVHKNGVLRKHIKKTESFLEPSVSVFTVEIFQSLRSMFLSHTFVINSVIFELPKLDNFSQTKSLTHNLYHF